MTTEIDRVGSILNCVRPWGQFQQFVCNETVTVKIITVAPGRRLSLQKHRHRDEMWHVLDLPLLVEVNDRTWTASPGEPVWVPRNAVHRISNPFREPARLLEIAFGDFDEADIERVQDDYGR